MTGSGLSLLLALSAPAMSAPPAPPGPDAIVGGMNRFGLELFGKLDRKDSDVAFSPVSASTAFGLAYAGARGETAGEIAGVLHYPDGADFHPRFGRLLRGLDLQRPDRVLTVRNALFVDGRTQLLPAYRALVQKHYRAGVQTVDFRNRDAAADSINGWVKTNTKGRIAGLIEANKIKPDMRAMLANTVYFKADWQEAFSPGETRQEPFTRADGTTVTQALMHQTDDFRVAEHDGVQGIVLPYRGGETEMVVLLPREPAGIAALEASLDAPMFNGWVERLAAAGPSSVRLTLPKFKIEQTNQLVEPLVALGMETPFTDHADFSGMKRVVAASSDREDWNFKIDSVVQKVVVEVDEKGTVAVAATGISMVVVTGVRMAVDFRADQPFLFFLRDRRNGAILFAGRYSGKAAS